MAPSDTKTEEASLGQIAISGEDWAQTPAAVQELVLSLIAHVQALEAEIYSLRLKADVFERLEFRIEQSLQGFPVRCVRLL